MPPHFTFALTWYFSILLSAVAPKIRTANEVMTVGSLVLRVSDLLIYPSIHHLEWAVRDEIYQ